MDGWVRAEIIVGGIASLAIFSFLWKENPFYRFFEHLFIGIGVGMLVVVNVRNYMWRLAIKPILGGTGALTPGPRDEFHWGYVLYLIPVLMGFLYYTIYSKKHRWMARIVIGFSLGMGGGFAFKGFFSEYIPQIIESFRPLYAVGEAGKFDAMATFNNLVFFITLFCVMSYFFFSVDHKLPVIKQTSITGRWLMMVTFGAFFGATVMARMALLVERLQFLIEDWYPALTHWAQNSGGGPGG